MIANLFFVFGLIAAAVLSVIMSRRYEDQVSASLTWWMSGFCLVTFLTIVIGTIEYGEPFFA